MAVLARGNASKRSRLECIVNRSCAEKFSNPLALFLMKRMRGKGIRIPIKALSFSIAARFENLVAARGDYHSL